MVERVHASPSQPRSTAGTGGEALGECWDPPRRFHCKDSQRDGRDGSSFIDQSKYPSSALVVITVAWIREALPRIFLLRDVLYQDEHASQDVRLRHVIGPDRDERDLCQFVTLQSPAVACSSSHAPRAALHLPLRAQRAPAFQPSQKASRERRDLSIGQVRTFALYSGPLPSADSSRDQRACLRCKIAAKVPA